MVKLLAATTFSRRLARFFYLALLRKLFFYLALLRKLLVAKAYNRLLAFSIEEEGSFNVKSNQAGKRRQTANRLTSSAHLALRTEP